MDNNSDYSRNRSNEYLGVNKIGKGIRKIPLHPNGRSTNMYLKTMLGIAMLLGRSSGFQTASSHRPCMKGLWLWSTPLRRTALDGTEYNLLLIDIEGIVAYDQTATYRTQILPIAVLLSSMFIYNQMGGIDEAAIDRLSLVTEMTKHIRVRASTTCSELGQFSPIFFWLLRENIEERWDESMLSRRMAISTNDYPGSGANDSQTPLPQLGETKR